MTETVAAVANRVPGCCHAMHCNRDRRRVDLKGAPSVRLLIDMDCDALQIPRQQKRCDYLFIGEEGTATWIAPIELKSGGLRATEVLDQLQGGMRAIEPCLPQGISFQLVPVLGPWEADPSDRTQQASLRENTTARAKETDRAHQVR